MGAESARQWAVLCDHNPESHIQLYQQIFIASSVTSAPTRGRGDQQDSLPIDKKPSMKSVGEGGGRKQLQAPPLTIRGQGGPRLSTWVSEKKRASKRTTRFLVWGRAPCGNASSWGVLGRHCGPPGHAVRTAPFLTPVLQDRKHNQQLLLKAWGGGGGGLGSVSGKDTLATKLSQPRLSKAFPFLPGAEEGRATCKTLPGR